MKSGLTAVDFFAGAGGLSFGVKAAGISVVGAYERDLWASQTYALNMPEVTVNQCDVTQVLDADFRAYRGVDIVLAGPPCQGFSIAASNRRSIDDKRNDLFAHLIRAIESIVPRVVVFENVREFAKFKDRSGRSYLEKLTSALAHQGYTSEYCVLNTAEYGIPQERIRFFLIAIRGGAQNSSSFLDFLRTERLHEPVTLWDAISDLPKVYPGSISELECLPYRCPARNAYQAALRTADGLWNHVPMRHTQRMVERFKMIRSGVTVSDLPAALRPRQRGAPESTSQKIYDQNHRRLNPHRPSPTITASFYSSFIHPFQHRNLTVREAARLQGFPDSFQFTGKRTTLSKKLLTKKGIFEELHLDQFNQVGNAVPPLFARILGNYVNLAMDVSDAA